MILFHASHEQFAPDELLRLAVLAESAGFDGIHSSDHFHPWSERQGQSGFAFAWMGAAMQATRIPCGMICAPGQRYHPAIVAQAAATLAQMFPGRFWMELGSGEALNEWMTGGGWPAKGLRQARLLECVSIIRRLLDGETVYHRGLVVVEGAKLYTRPAVMPPLIGAAISAETAAGAGAWADGLITISQPMERLREVVQAFRDHGGGGKPIYLKVQLSYARDERIAMEGAYDQWRSNALPPRLAADMYEVAHFDAISDFVTMDELRKSVHISADLQEHVGRLRAYQAIGIDHLVLHNVCREQEAFIEDFGKHVLPGLSG